METPLCKLAFKYGTDKCLKIKHPYTPFYYKLLKSKKKSIKKVMEMGIYKGASLYMWEDFFPNAQIYGVDISPETLFKGGRIKTFLCDQRNEKDLVKLVKKTGTDIDLFIDDGSHNSEHQIFTCQILLPLFKKDVIYIIEDVLFPDRIKRALKQFNCEAITLKDRKYRDDRLMVITHKA